jgi:hypothetical protein
MAFRDIADELKSKLKRDVPAPPEPSLFQMYGGWASPVETDDDPYVSEGEARRAGRDALVDLYKQRGWID